MDGERSSVKTTHPLLSAIRPCARRSNLLVDRASVHEQIYGRQGQTTANYLNAPAALPLARTRRWEFNVDKANQILDAAGLEARAPTASAPRTASG